MRKTNRQPHGMALMLVMSTIAIASLIGLAMLSAASLQAQVASNSQNGAVADYLAESGLQTACYYIQRDNAKAPAMWTNTPGHKLYASGVTVSGVTGSFDIDAVATSITDEYLITATGRSGGASAVTRSATARMRVQRTSPAYAIGFGGTSVNIGLRNIFNGGSVVYSGAIVNLGTLNGGSRSFSASDFTVPSTAAGQVSYYGGSVANGTYTMPNGNTGTPQILSSGTLSSPAMLSALSTNPGKVFYYNGHIVITGAGTYTGTLIARGNLDIRPALGSTVNINRVSGFPAVVTDGALALNSRNLSVNINGVAWLGTGLSWSAVNSTGTNVRINGALLTPVTSLPTAVGTLTVNYTAANADVVHLTPSILQTPVGIKLVSWQQ